VTAVGGRPRKYLFCNGEASGENAAGQELAELALDEAGKTAAVGAIDDASQAQPKITTPSPAAIACARRVCHSEAG